MQITNPKKLTFTNNSFLKYQFIAIEGTAPYKFKTTSVLPAGLTLNRKGILKGTPTSVTSFRLRLKAISSNGESIVKVFTITISAPTTTTAPNTTLSNVYVAKNFNTISTYDRNTSTGLLSESSVANTDFNPQAFCISYDGKNVYVASSYSKTISTYDRNTSTGELTANGTIPIGVLTANGTIATGALTSNTAITTADRLQAICISPDGKNVYVTNGTVGFSGNTVSIFDRNTSTGALSESSVVNIDYNPYGICISPDSKNVYVTNFVFGSFSYDENIISIFDRNTSTGALTANGNINTYNTTGPFGICVSADGKNIYVACKSGDVYIFNRNTSTGALVKNTWVPVFWSAKAICISPDGKNVYAVEDYDITIFDRNASTGLLIQSSYAATGHNPQAICISADGKNIYVVSLDPEEILIYDRNTSTGALTANGTITIGTLIAIATIYPLVGICIYPVN